MNIKTVPQAIDDMAVSLGASPSAQIPTVSQALENVYAALGGTRTDLDTMVVSEVIDLITPLIPGGGGGGGGDISRFFEAAASSEAINRDVTPTEIGHGDYRAVVENWITIAIADIPDRGPLFFDEFTISVEGKTLTFPMVNINGLMMSDTVDGWKAELDIADTETELIINLIINCPSDWSDDAHISADAVSLLIPTEEFYDVMNR